METSKVISPYFQVFEDPIDDDSITEFEYIEYLPNNSSNMNKLGEHKIETRDLDKYLLPHKVMLEGRGKLVKAADNSNYATTDVVTFVNNGWSLFRSIQYQIDGHLVEDVNHYLPQASMIMNLVQFLDDYSRIRRPICFGIAILGGAEPNEFGVL